ncbi:MAG TPA: EthD family reductase [Nocardioides sp.]|nr:EthD family reductase [Nocardioides sp.]
MYRLTVVYDEPADKEAFERRYTDEHVPLVKAVPGLERFQLSHPAGGTPYLVAELIWPSEDAFKASAATPEMAATQEHAAGCGTTFAVYAGDVAEI